MVINSEFWNNLKEDLLFAKVFIWEIFFFIILLFFVVYQFLFSFRSFLLFTFFTIILLITLFYFIGKKRKKLVNEIHKSIRSLSSNAKIEEKDIKLDSSLEPLKKEIIKFYNANRINIEYLQKLEKMRTQFIANVSHELRTPIFAIQGFLETLMDGAIDDPKVNRHFLNKANQHTQNLNNLLNELIDISMIESGEMRMSFRFFYLKDFLDPILEEFSNIGKNKNIIVSCNEYRERLQVYGDKNKIKQVFNNLLQNAVKYTEKGEINIIIEETPDFVLITIKDTGIGIPNEDIHRIFERFYRVDKARSKDVGGTGLGLAIVKHIIEAHNSKISVKSEINKGSEFTFFLKK